jgi:hypothetical protein
MDPNPYQSPASIDEKPPDVVDRDERDRLAVLVRRFLDEDLSAFAFDDLLGSFRDSADGAVRFVADAVWYHYDDCDDHFVALSKAEWDYFQRLLLLLESDRSVEVVKSRRWAWSQLFAGAALLAFIGIAIRLGWGYHLFLVAIPFGAVSIAISKLRVPALESNSNDPILFPFATFKDLASAYDAVRFKKKRLPRHVAGREIRTPFKAAVQGLHLYATWLILSPIPLAFQMFPQRVTEARVVPEERPRSSVEIAALE